MNSEILTDDDPGDVFGGESGTVVVQPVGFKRCAADSPHVYVEMHDA